MIVKVLELNSSSGFTIKYTNKIINDKISTKN